MQIFEKLKALCGLLLKFLKSKWNVDHFERNYEPHRLINLDIIDSERNGYLNVVTGTKVCWNLHDGTFIFFFHPLEILWAGK